MEYPLTVSVYTITVCRCPRDIVSWHIIPPHYITIIRNIINACPVNRVITDTLEVHRTPKSAYCFDLSYRQAPRPGVPGVPFLSYGKYILRSNKPPRLLPYRGPTCTSYRVPVLGMILVSNNKTKGTTRLVFYTHQHPHVYPRRQQTGQKT